MKNELTTPQLTPAVQTLVETIRNEIEAGKERAYLAMDVEHQINIILFTELFIIRFGYDLGGFPNYSHNIQNSQPN